MRVSPIFDANSVLTQYVAVKQDITRQRELDEELYQYAILDHLTGAYNRRILVQMGGREVSLAQRYDRPLALLLLDIDCLGKLNHLYGYSAGDDILRQVALVCRSQMRETDLLARLEADCFALLLPDAKEQGAYLVAERIRREVASISFRGPKEDFSCTVSISGVLLSADYGDLEQMLQAGQRLLHLHPGVFDRIVGIYDCTVPLP